MLAPYQLAGYNLRRYPTTYRNHGTLRDGLTDSLFFDLDVVPDPEVEADDGFVAALLDDLRRNGRGARRRIRGVHADDNHVALRQRSPRIPIALRVLCCSLC